MDGAANCSEAHGGMKNSGGGKQESKERAGLNQMMQEGGGHVLGLWLASPLGTSTISPLCHQHQPWPHVLPSFSPHLQHPADSGHPQASTGTRLQPQSIMT